jgi:gas vesicle protein
MELQRQAVELLDRLAKEPISPRKRTELANAVKKQTDYLKVKQTDKEIASNLNHLHKQISKALQTFPNLKNRHPAASTLLSEVETLVKKITGEFTHPDGKSGV